MFSLQNLSASVPVYRHAGRFGLDFAALLWPLVENDSGEGVWLLPAAAFSKAFDPQARSGWKRSTQVSRTALRDYALLLRPGGQFFSTDKLSLSRIYVHDNQCVIDLALVRPENSSGTPAPRSLYVVLSFDPGEGHPQNLTLHINGIWRDFRGHESPLSEPVASDLTVEFSE